MAGVINQHAASLLEAARKEGKLEELYRSALDYSENADLSKELPPQELRDFVHSMVSTQVRPALGRFLELAREELRMIDVEVVSAIPLKPEQVAQLERRLIQTVKKRVNIKTAVDPSIIGGLRVVIGNYVVDNSIKNQMERMRETLYERVYFGNEENTC